MSSGLVAWRQGCEVAWLCDGLGVRWPECAVARFARAGIAAARVCGGLGVWGLDVWRPGCVAAWVYRSCYISLARPCNVMALAVTASLAK